MEKGSEVKDYVKNIYSSSFPHHYQRFAGPHEVLLFLYPARLQIYIS